MFKTYVGPVESQTTSLISAPKPPRLSSPSSRTCSMSPGRRSPSAFARLAKRSATRSTRATSLFAPVNSSRWKWSSSSGRTKRWRRNAAAWRAVPAAGHPGEPAAKLGLGGLAQYWVEERMSFYESIGLPRTSLEELLAEAGGAGALCQGDASTSFTNSLRRPGTRRHCRPGRLRPGQHQKFSGKSMEYLTTSSARPGPNWTTPQTMVQQRLADSKRQALLKKGLDATEAAAQAEAESRTSSRGLPRAIISSRHRAQCRRRSFDPGAHLQCL